MSLAGYIETQPFHMLPSYDASTKMRKFKCDLCSFTCDRPSDVQRHMLVHTGERPYKCSVCENSFRRKAHLKRHVFTHYKKNDDTS